MKRLILIALMLPAAAHAACPDIPAAERVRIVECRSGYAVQEAVTVEKIDCNRVGCLVMHYPTKVTEWRTVKTCGMGRELAELEKLWLIRDKEMDDAIACAPLNLPLEPVRVVE
jgi:hypothetical protein